MSKRHARAVSASLKMLFAVFLLLLPLVAAAADGDGKLPYEAGLQTLYTSLTGTVPFAISLVGIVACGAMLIFGGEISGFMRTLVFIVLVIAIIVQAASLITVIGGKDDPFTATGHAADYKPNIA